jgi:uncharacterized membrane protein (UPF0182 family)
MRPPLPSIRVSKKARIALWTVAIIIILIVALIQLSGVYINFMWFDSVGFRGVYTTVFWTRVSLFFIFGGLMALIIGGNLVIAYFLSPPFRPMSPEQQNIERYRAFLEPRRIIILVIAALISLFAAGTSAQGDWATWQLWLHGGSFGQTDPQFHLDLSFYAWDYPVYRLLLSFGFTAIIFSTVLSVLVHYLTGAIRLQTPGPKVTVAARRHLTLLVFVFVVLKAIAYWLDRYGLVFSDRSSFTGASYTDVHAVLPARTILFWIALVIAAGLIASLWLRSTLLPGIAFISMLVLSILISGIYPAILQQVSVKPNASTKEAPYIERNLEATRTAYGIQLGKDVFIHNDYPALGNPSVSALDQNNPTLSDIRVLDPNLLSPTFTNLQRIRQQYGFPDKLDIDRYTLDGDRKDYIVGVRELDAASLTGDQGNWINLHTVYTHGYGFVAAPASENVTTSKNAFASYNISPMKGPLAAEVSQPRIYYGELLPDYSIVGASGPPQEYDASDGPKYTYTGSGGVSLSNFFTRLAFAINYKQTNFLLNDAASAKGAKIIFNRDPRTMVAKAAPYLTVDGDPYPFIDKATGHIMWMVDAYTTMDNYPYSQRNSLSALTTDTLSQTGQTASQPNSQINYIRNSVKATIDAYTGKVTLYAWNQERNPDPVLQAWERIFPGTVQQTMPQSIEEHVRYPQDLFEVQRSLLGSYHVTNPVTFYNVGDKWTVPNDPAEKTTSQPPYYVVASDPNQPDGSAPQFQLTTPMIVNNSTNMAAYVSVDSDPGNDYGHMTVLRVPNNAATRGPEQVANILNSNTTISSNISLLERAGSTVLEGNLLTLPIGDSFLYVEPLYVQGTATNGTYPVLQRVLVVYGDGSKIGFEQNLSQALTDLEPGHHTGESLANGGSDNQTNPPTTQTSSPPPPPTSSSSSPTNTPPGGGPGKPVTEAQVAAAAQAFDDALRSGNQTEIIRTKTNLDRLYERYLEQQLNTSSPSSSARSTPPKSSATP